MHALLEILFGVLFELFPLALEFFCWAPKDNPSHAPVKFEKKSSGFEKPAVRSGKTVILRASGGQKDVKTAKKNSNQFDFSPKKDRPVISSGWKF